MGHSFLPDWCSYARFLLPVIYQLTYSTMLMAFMTSLCLLASPLAQSLIILFMFMLSIFVVVSLPWPKSLWLWGVARRYRFRPPQKNRSKSFGGTICPTGWSVGVNFVLARDHQDLIRHPFHNFIAESIGAKRGERPGLVIVPFSILWSDS